jgi:hypothetical protein
VTLSRTAFDAISARLKLRAKDFALIAKTGYSFEEWITCESYVACKKKWPGSVVSPRPRYSEVGSTLPAFGDLLIPRKLSKLLIEIGVIHARTGSKWDRKIEDDSRKLASIADAQALQLVIVVSNKRATEKVFVEMKKRSSRFNSRPRFNSTVGLGVQVAHLFGWTEHEVMDDI